MSPTLIPDAGRLRLECLSATDAVIRMVVASTQQEAPCPVCRRTSSRIHSHYVRTLADLPWNGVAVRLQLTVHRFFCAAEDCRRRIFAEQLPSVAAPYARRTIRLTEVLELIGFALGGEAGARVVKGLSMQASPDTLLRVIRATDLPERETPRVLGVDDFSFRRGRTYGTILIDLERHCRVDMLPDRTAESLVAWLTAHPGVEIMGRDRGGAYADGARRGAPDALQVTDRFHVVANLREALERLLTRNHGWLGQAAAALVATAQPAAVAARAPAVRERGPPRQTRLQREAEASRTSRLARYEEVRALHEQGMSVRAIAQQLGRSRQTVTRFAKAETFPERVPRSPQCSRVDRYAAYLRRRWNEGCQNAAQLWRELRAQGFTGSRPAVGRWVRRWRTGRGRSGPPARDSPTSPAPPTIRARSPRQASWLMVLTPSDLDPEDQAYLEQLVQLSHEVATAYPLAQQFGQLVRERDQAALEPWLGAAEQTQLPELVGFAAGIRRDQAAVDQMLLTNWSNGQTEGQINRLKLLKRQMYGRAKFDLLRRRVLHAS